MKQLTISEKYEKDKPQSSVPPPPPAPTSFFSFALTEKHDFVKHSDVDWTSFSNIKWLP